MKWNNMDPDLDTDTTSSTSRRSSKNHDGGKHEKCDSGNQQSQFHISWNRWPPPAGSQAAHSKLLAHSQSRGSLPPGGRQRSRENHNSENTGRETHGRAPHGPRAREIGFS